MISEVNYLAREIFEILEDEGMQTIKQLEARFKHEWSVRTFGYAIKQLKDAGLIVRIPNLMDMRQGAYKLTKEAEKNGMYNMLRNTEDRQLRSSTD